MGAVAAAILEAGPPSSRSENMSRLLEVARRVAGTDANVLLTGESGTGKGALARYLHDASPRRAKVLCESASKPYRAYCFEGVGTIIGGFHAEQEGRRAECRKVTTQYYRDCARGAVAL